MAPTGSCLDRYRSIQAIRLVACVVIALILALSSACSRGNLDAEKHEAEQLMARYGLHAAGPPQVSQMELPADRGFASASKAVGLDSTRYQGQDVEMLGYTLKERWGSSLESTLSAVFACRNGKVVGAVLGIQGSLGGPLPLSELQRQRQQ